MSSSLRYHALAISGTSGRRKKPARAMGSEMTVSTMKSHCQPFQPWTPSRL
ncbi:major facilitator superfamily transporter [Colletotrichum asianum]